MSTSTNPEAGSITARSWFPTPGAAVRQAATVVVLRRSDAGMQVLLMRRAPREGDIHSGACVFPGGLLDAADAEGSALCSGLDDAQASARLGLPAGGLAYWFAALRECFEEAGLLYAAAQDRSHLDVAQLAQIAAQRDALNRRELTMAAICQRFGIHLAADRIAGRNTQGVTILKTGKGEHVVSVVPVPEGEAMEDETDGTDLADGNEA